MKKFVIHRATWIPWDEEDPYEVEEPVASIAAALCGVRIHIEGSVPELPRDRIDIELSPSQAAQAAAELISTLLAIPTPSRECPAGRWGTALHEPLS